jgi:hypothetical protein
MPTKKQANINIPDPLLVRPYSIVTKPFPVPTITDICEGNQFRVLLPCALTPYILGALESWVWSDSFEGTPQEQEIAVGLFRDLQGVIAMASRNCDCDPDQIIRHRINPETGEVEQSTDDGATWTTDPQSPYVLATVVSPLPGADSPDKQCQAANNVIEEMQRLVEVYAGYIGVINGLADLMSAILVEVATMLFIAVGAGQLGDVLTPLLSKVFDTARMLSNTSVEAWNALFTENNWNTARCILVCNGHENGRYSQNDWQNIRDDLLAQLGSGAQSCGRALESMVWFWELTGLNNAASTGSNATTNCDDCACGDCSNLDNWQIVYGNVIFQEPGHLTINSGDAGSGNVAVRIANYSQGLSGGCCTITYDTHSAGIQNMARYECGSPDAIPGLIPQSTCGYDFAWTNIFGEGFTIDIYFVDCP